MTGRGRFALALGVLTYVCAWAFGSKPLYPVAVGLVLAVVVSWAWVGLANRPMRLHRRLPGGDHVEGDDVLGAARARARRRRRARLARARERIAKLGERRTPIGSRQGGLPARAASPAAATSSSRRPRSSRTRSASSASRSTCRRAAPCSSTRGSSTLEPALLGERARATLDGRRLLLRRPSGFELHGVREHVEGESLRRVHWPSTARRGELMVKELEDAPRDEVAVLLDCDARVGRRQPPDSSFDAPGARRRLDPAAPTRAAGAAPCSSLNSRGRETQRVALVRGRLARARSSCSPPSSRARLAPAAALLADEGGAGGALARARRRHRRRSTGRSLDRLLQRALGRHSVSLVYVDAASFAPGAAAPARSRRCSGSSRSACPSPCCAAATTSRPRSSAPRAGGSRACVRVGRTALLLPLPGALIAFGWARIEQPAAPALEVVWVAVLGLAPALLPRLWMRLAAAARRARARRAHRRCASPSRRAAARRPARLLRPARLALRPRARRLLRLPAAVRPAPARLHARRRRCSRSSPAASASASAVAARPAGARGARAARLGGVADDAATPARATCAAARSCSSACCSCWPPCARCPAAARASRSGSPTSSSLAALGVSTSPAVAKGEFLNWQTWDLYTRARQPGRRLVRLELATTAGSRSRRR